MLHKSSTAQKQQQLITLLQSYGSAAVGFSGGVDSSVLAKAAFEALGDKAIAITGASALMTDEEIAEARRTAKKIGIRHEVIKVDDLADSRFTANDKMRCYYCHINRFKTMQSYMDKHGLKYILDGSNEDDKGDYRPGMIALQEFAAAKSPFLELHITKAEIRQMAKDWQLPVWNKPSSACLASRLVYGLTVTEQRLIQVGKAEQIVRRYAKGQVRVRHHGELARIEVEPNEIAAICQTPVRETIEKAIKALGFKFVTIDMGGYKKGSNNVLLDKEK